MDSLNVLVKGGNVPLLPSKSKAASKETLRVGGRVAKVVADTAAPAKGAAAKRIGRSVGFNDTPKSKLKGGGKIPPPSSTVKHRVGPNPFKK